MADNVKFSRLAQKDLEDSYEWYEDQKYGLVNTFAEAVYSAAITISRNPTAYPTKKTNTREFQLKEFPFIIIYQHKQKEDLIKILRVFHTRRNPKFKYKQKI